LLVVVSALSQVLDMSKAVSELFVIFEICK